MLQKLFNNKLLVIGIHILIGYMCTFAFFPKLYGTFILVGGILIILFSSNNNEEALLVSAYVVGAEVFLRMTHGTLSYEIGKYSVLLFLLLGLLLGKVKQRISLTYIIYIMLLLPGIINSKVPDGESLRRSIVFNLSGPVVLGVAGLYLYKRSISKKQLFELLFLMVLPIFSMVTYLFFRTPDIKNIVFGGVSNFAASGGFGPNQVATAIGIGIFILSIFIFLKQKLSGFLVLDGLFLAYFIYRGLLTFSRGGIISAGAALLFFIIFIILYKKQPIKNTIKSISILLIFIISIWTYTSGVTGGKLDNRYAGKNAIGQKKRDATAGRGKIFNTQLQSYYDAPLFGIGVGNGKYKRELSMAKVTAASHNEVSRLLEEHGSIGLIILIILIMVPLFHSYNRNNYERAFLISFYVFWFLTINHSAMRVAFPGFIYGLSLLNIVEDEKL